MSINSEAWKGNIPNIRATVELSLVQVVKQWVVAQFNRLGLPNLARRNCGPLLGDKEINLGLS